MAINPLVEGLEPDRTFSSYVVKVGFGHHVPPSPVTNFIQAYALVSRRAAFLVDNHWPRTCGTSAVAET
jgi:hypothetical protein